MVKQNDLGNDKVSSLVLKLAVPTMIAQFVNVLYSIVDRMYIGNIAEVGELALAGVGICGPIVTLLSSFATLVGLGGAPILAMKMGENNYQQAEKVLANCFMMLVVFSLMLSGGFFLFKEQILMWFGASGTTFVYANDYMSVYTVGTIFALFSVGLNSFIICQGYSTVAMTTVLIGAVLNIVLDPIFIFSMNMGVKGAAVATVISQMASCICVLRFLFSQHTPIRITFKGYSIDTVKEVINFGLSPFIIISTDSILLIVMNIALKTYGGTQSDVLIAGVTIMQSYLMLVTMPLGGISGGTQPILSFNYGAKNISRIKEGVKYTLILGISFTTFMFLLSKILPKIFVLIFTRDPELMQMSIDGIKVFTMGIIPLSVQYVLVDALTALGLTKYSLFLSLLRKVMFLSLTLLLPIYFGAKGVFFAEPISDIGGACVSTITFLMVFRLVMRKYEKAPQNSSVTKIG